MAITNWRHSTETEVAQVVTITITGVSTSMTAVWTLTLTDESGDTHTVTYTESSPTVALIATGLYAAVLASTNPFFADLTPANPSAGVLTLTAATAGRPISVGLADNDDGTHTQSNTTASVGNNDYGLAQNWSLDAAPVATNDVVFGAGNKAVLWGLQQSSVAIDEFNIEQGHNADIGQFEHGIPFYLVIDPNSLVVEGKGSLTMLNIGSANIGALIRSFAPSRTDGRRAVYLLGSDMTTVEILKGDVGIAMLEQETAVVVTLVVGYDTIPQSDAKVYLGPGVTLTTALQQAGLLTMACAATTVTVGENATLFTEGAGAITTMNVYGTAYPKSTGTITTLNAHGLVDFTRDRSDKTITTLVEFPGGHVRIHAGITITNRTKLAAAGEFKLEYVD